MRLPSATSPLDRAEVYRDPSASWTCSGARERLRSAGRRDRAERLLREELARRTDEPGLWAEFGEDRRKAQFHVEAEAAFTRAIELAPSMGWFQALRGRARAQARLEGADSDLDRAAELEPACGWIRCWRGEQLRRRGRLAEALAEFDEGLRLLPSYAPAYAWRGAARSAVGEAGAAHADLTQAVALDPLYAPPFAERARLRLGLGRIAEAFADMEEAVRLDPKHSWADPQAPRLPGGAAPDADWAVLRLGAAHAALPDGRALGWRGEARLRQGRPGPALRDLEGAAALRSGWGRAHAWRGEALRRLGRLGPALEALERAVRLDPAYYFGWAWKGLVLRDQGEPAKALRSLSRAVRLNESLPSRAFSLASWLLSARGSLTAELGRLDEAEEDLRRAVGLDPGDRGTRLALARVYRARGRRLDALRELKLAGGGR